MHMHIAPRMSTRSASYDATATVNVANNTGS